MSSFLFPFPFLTVETGTEDRSQSAGASAHERAIHGPGGVVSPLRYRDSTVGDRRMRWVVSAGVLAGDSRVAGSKCRAERRNELHSQLQSAR